MFRSRRLYLSLLGVAALSTTSADLVFSVLDVASLLVGKVSYVSLPIAATTLDVVAICCVGVFSTQYAWRRDGIIHGSVIARRILTGICILLSVPALVVSIVSIVTIKNRKEEVTAATSRAPISNWDGYLIAHIIVWASACATQIILYSIPLWNKPVDFPLGSVSQSGPRDSVMSEVRHSNNTGNLYMLEPTQPASPLAGLPSPTFSARSSQSLKSWRDSLHQVVRPVTSRTKLINRPSFTRDARSMYSDSQSIDNMSTQDAFDTWDTSSVDPQSAAAVMQSAPSRGTALEPIPGSRPASPARPLDGPFPQSDEPDDDFSRALSPPPVLRPDTSRPPSPAVSEAHIHPLFRTESPIPPPEITSGTNITASPLATQMIPCPQRPYARMRSHSNSRGASPTPPTLMHSQSFDRSRAMSPNRSLRSPSPPSREMTPPIPDFVLNSSPRSSLSNNRKKVNLQLDTRPSTSASASPI